MVLVIFKKTYCLTFDKKNSLCYTIFLIPNQIRIYNSGTTPFSLSNCPYSVFTLKTVAVIDHSGVTAYLITEAPAKLH